ncbi:UNKNOWN [Stylonychia lemnae]|uniref:Uncharacterized protein n=1 Tax=Stylonychia lemnae TaxID=5949 RepID=A0A077ZY00_STYLE|nr:UNKNOWN [Stylonychia lemnae]|eukprot:CDW73406.1 UNKNOWN [Stylonychia lemnae]
MNCEVQTQTDYSLSDISRLEDLKSTLFDEKQRIEHLIREVTSYKELRKRINELYYQEIKIKPQRQQRINIKVQKINNKPIELKKKSVDPVALLTQNEKILKKRINNAAEKQLMLKKSLKQTDNLSQKHQKLAKEKVQRQQQSEIKEQMKIENIEQKSQQYSNNNPGSKLQSENSFDENVSSDQDFSDSSTNAVSSLGNNHFSSGRSNQVEEKFSLKSFIEQGKNLTCDIQMTDTTQTILTQQSSPNKRQKKLSEKVSFKKKKESLLIEGAIGKLNIDSGVK